MSSVDNSASLAQSEAGIVSAIHALFRRYGRTFVALANGQRSDVGALLEFYVTVLNARAALVDSVWLRRDTRGALMSRFAVLYLVALTAEGWRITSAVNTSS